MSAWNGYVYDMDGGATAGAKQYEVPLATGLPGYGGNALPRPFTAAGLEDPQGRDPLAISNLWPINGTRTHNLATWPSHSSTGYDFLTYGEQDLFNHFLVVPSILNLGNLLTNQVRTLEVANLYFGSKQINNVQNFAGTGITFPGLSSFPQTIRSFSSYVLQVAVSTQGQPSINGNIELDVSDVGGANPIALEVPITGQRITLFPFDPEQGYTEELQWKTDIIESYNGTEQRISVRLNARQVLTYQVFATDPQRDMAMRIAVFNWMALVWGVPIWWEQTPSTAVVPANTSVIPANTTLGDFRGTGFLVMIMSVDYKTYETFEIASMTSSAITLTSQTVNTYPAGSKVMPVRTAYAKTDANSSVYVTGQEKFTMQFTTLDNIDLSNITGMDLYQGLPILDDINFVESTLTEGMSRNGVTIIDNQSGTIYQVASTDRSRPRSQKTWYTGDVESSGNGQSAIWTIRGFLHWTNGSQQTFWLPTNRNDLVPIADIASGSASVQCKAVGYSLYGINANGPMRPFGDIRITLTNGTTILRQLAGCVQSSSTVETFSCTTPIATGSTIPLATIARIEFLQLVRIIDDKATLTHDHPGRAKIQINVVGVLS